MRSVRGSIRTATRLRDERTPGHRSGKHQHARGVEDAPLTVHAEYGQDTGLLTFTPGATCTLTATADVLTVRIDADCEQSMTRVRDVITRDLQRFGRREALIVCWQ
jgi:hypothetical protein